MSVLYGWAGKIVRVDLPVSPGYFLSRQSFNPEEWACDSYSSTRYTKILTDIELPEIIAPLKGKAV